MISTGRNFKEELWVTNPLKHPQIGIYQKPELALYLSEKLVSILLWGYYFEGLSKL